MKNILLCTDGSVFAKSSYQYGAWFATRLEASVDVLYVTDTRSQTVAASRDLSGNLGFGESDNLMNELVTLEHEKAKLNHQHAKQILAEAQQALANNGVESVKLIHKDGFLVDCFHEFEGNADLVILGKRGEAAEFASGHLGANLERIVRSSHKPCLITSRQFRPTERLLIAYDGSDSGKKILDFLTNSTIFKGLELHIITVCKNAEDEKAIARIEEARSLANMAGFKPICCLAEGNSEAAIAEYAEENAIDLLLMGAYGHSRIRHLVIGSTTVQILRSSHIPVLLFR